MQLKQRTVFTIIFMTGLALIGLVFIQVYFLYGAIRLKQEAFRHNVNAALSNVTAGLETQETLYKIMQVALEADSAIAPIAMRTTIIHDSSGLVASQRQLEMYLDSLRQSGSGKKAFTYVIHSSGTDRGLHAKSTNDQNFFRYTFNFDSDTSQVDFNNVKVKTESTKFVVGRSLHVKFDDNINKAPVRKILIDKVFGELTGQEKKEVLERVEPASLDSLLEKSLKDQSIQTVYHYGITESDSVLMASPQAVHSNILASRHKSRLFPTDILGEPNYLTVYFPSERLYLMSEIGAPVLVSFVFIAIITICFVYVIRLLFRQRRFSERLTGFINNMVHEFKTPIATIELAGESLMKTSPREKAVRYHKIIRDENSRMRDNVEKILQIAALEEGDFELNLQPVNLEQLLGGVIEKFRLQFEKRVGRIETQYEAIDPALLADKFHLENIVSNLLDNAIKYTEGAPEIIIRTKTTETTGLQVDVEDNGIGVVPEERERIFDKYYRVPTGNIHNVKGFGLGLSYVQLIMQAHGGAVSVVKKNTKGSVFRLIFSGKTTAI